MSFTLNSGNQSDSETGSGSMFSDGEGGSTRSGSVASGGDDFDESTGEIEMTTSASPPLLGSGSSSSAPRRYGAVEYSPVRGVDEYGVPFMGLEHSVNDRQDNNV